MPPSPPSAFPTPRPSSCPEILNPHSQSCWICRPRAHLISAMWCNPSTPWAKLMSTTKRRVRCSRISIQSLISFGMKSPTPKNTLSSKIKWRKLIRRRLKLQRRRQLPLSCHQLQLWLHQLLRFQLRVIYLRWVSRKNQPIWSRLIPRFRVNLFRRTKWKLKIYRSYRLDHTRYHPQTWTSFKLTMKLSRSKLIRLRVMRRRRRVPTLLKLLRSKTSKKLKRKSKLMLRENLRPKVKLRLRV